MRTKATFYGIKDRMGYVHGRCLNAYYENNARRDAQDRIVSGPMIDSLIEDLGDAGKGTCLHCRQALVSDNERAALALAADKTALCRRLREAIPQQTDPKLFGKGRFDFAKRRLIGANGLVLQWQTRPEPDQPETSRNEQYPFGYVFLMCPVETKTES